MLANCEIAFSSLTQKRTQKVVFIKNKIDTYPVASFSVILSSAAYILYHFPNLPHPTDPLIKKSHKRYDQQYPSSYMSLHPFFDEWMDVLSQSFLQGNAVRKNQTLYLKVKVCPEFIEELIKNQAQFSQFESDQTVYKLFKIPKTQEKVKNIGWINCSTSQMSKARTSPTVNTISILLGQIYDNQNIQKWDILLNLIPTVEKLLQYDTLVIPGSGLSVLDSNKYVDSVAKNIMIAYKKSNTLKIFGICYGHQLIARELGAKVTKRERYGGLQLIKFNKEVINSYNFLQPLRKYNLPHLHLSEHHEDFVVTTPQGLIKLAESNSCENEALVSKDGRIFTTQFHPEYNYAWAKAYTTRANIYYNGRMLDKPKYSHSSQAIQKHFKACEDFRLCISLFI